VPKPLPIQQTSLHLYRTRQRYPTKRAQGAEAPKSGLLRQVGVARIGAEWNKHWITQRLNQIVIFNRIRLFKILEGPYHVYLQAQSSMRCPQGDVVAMGNEPVVALGIWTPKTGNRECFWEFAYGLVEVAGHRV
jgi:hypothetical protein